MEQKWNRSGTEVDKKMKMMENWSKLVKKVVQKGLEKWNRTGTEVEQKWNRRGK